MKIVWTELALGHLHSTYDYIAGDNALAAESTVEKIINTTEHLSRHPRLGHAGRLENTRELSVPGLPYIVAYRLQSNQLEILAVFHAARKWAE